jgi:hypothetical protein
MVSISSERLREGYLAYQQRERRDAVYNTATFLTKHFWGKPREVAEGLGVVLLVWNAVFYRRGSFDFDALEKCITDNQHVLDEFRGRGIVSYTPKDDAHIWALFNQFLEALRVCEGGSKGQGSPVGVAKALHLLAPDFFPIWDHAIAKAYGYYSSADAAKQYTSFLRTVKYIVQELAPSVKADGKTLLKLIYEYHYALHTRGWIR